MTAYYNENNAKAVIVLRFMIDVGVIAPGVVDDRSIKDVQASDLKGFTQCHFFAGGGFWSLTARMAGWHDDRPFWSASCPCQPYSNAGIGAGDDDPRNLWPDLYRIIRAARIAGYGPVVLMGEQVASKAGKNWFVRVRADLEREGIRARTVDFPACAVNAPHQRQRQYWCGLADAIGDGQEMARHAERIAAARSGWAVDRCAGPDDHDRSTVADANNIGWRSGQGWQTDRLKSNDLFAPLADAESRVSGRNVKVRRPDERTVDWGSHAGGWRALVNTARIRWPEGFTESGILKRIDAVANADLFGGVPWNMGNAIFAGLEGLGKYVDRSGRTRKRTIEARPVAETDGGERPDYCEYFSACYDPNRCNHVGSGGHPCFLGRGIPDGIRWTEDDGYMADSDQPIVRQIAPTRQLGVDEQNERPVADSASGSGSSERGREIHNGSPWSGQYRRFDGDESNYWSNAEWIVCHDGKARRTQPDIRFLVDGLPGRVDLWSIAGNAIVPPQAVEAIAALMDVLDALP